jgi:hypothetical protein
MRPIRSILPSAHDAPRARRVGASLAVVAVGAALAPAGAGAQAPPLTGETLKDLNSSTVTITRSCNPQGTSTINFTASGPATGPYPGTFTETGTITIGPQTQPPGAFFPSFTTGPIASFNASFTINSPSGQVTGSKSYQLDPQGRDFGICAEFSGKDVPELGASNASGFLAEAFAYNLRYQAQIVTPAGSGSDTGQAEAFPGAFSVQSTTSSSSGNDFLENFVSSTGPIPPPVPTTADECKKDGWKTYGIFKNQGDCVSYVATHGKNEPGKNNPK